MLLKIKVADNVGLTRSNVRGSAVRAFFSGGWRGSVWAFGLYKEGQQ